MQPTSKIKILMVISVTSPYMTIPSLFTLHSMLCHSSPPPSWFGRFGIRLPANAIACGPHHRIDNISFHPPRALNPALQSIHSLYIMLGSTVFLPQDQTCRIRDIPVSLWFDTLSSYIAHVSSSMFTGSLLFHHDETSASSCSL